MEFYRQQLKNNLLRISFPQSPDTWRQARMLAEISCKKRGITKIIVPGKLFERLVRPREFLLEFQDDIMVNKSLGAVAGNAFSNDIHVFGRNVQLPGIPVHITVPPEIHLDQFHEGIEQIPFSLGGRRSLDHIRKPRNIVMKTYEKCLELVKDKFVQTLARALSKIQAKQHEH